MITISLCMIVKNEEQVLDRCLSSYQGIYDELIIVDTGSTDNTRQIAYKYTNKVYDYKWNNNFAEARNYAFSLATCDYIFSADADEEIDTKNRHEFLSMKQILLPKIDIVQMYYVNMNEIFDTDATFQSVYNCKKEYRPKLFKRLRTFQWISPIHETVRLEPVIYDSEIEIMHKPVSTHKKRDFALFHELIEKNVHLEDYCLIMLCKELFISGTDEDFLSFGDTFEQRFATEYPNQFCQENITCVLARFYRLQNNSDSFFALCMDAYAKDPCAELCMELGHYFKQKKLYDAAIHWYEDATKQECYIDVRANSLFAFEQLSDCYGILASQAKALNNQELFESFYSRQYQYDCQAKAWTLPEEN